ncbi:MAG: acetyl-CoA carboxylase biotin carboxyl carrier protein [Pseudomonadota bacterium]
MSTNNHDSDVAFISALAKLLRDQDLTEIEVRRDYAEDDALTVRVARGGAVAPVAMAAQAAAPAPSVPSPAPAAAPSPAPDAGGEDPAQHPGAVTSPMVGTVYLQPEPGAASFVSLGDQVSEGQTIAIIEAMKTMNQIPAPRAGVVKRILVEDGGPVEFGAPLIILE